MRIGASGAVPCLECVPAPLVREAADFVGRGWLLPKIASWLRTDGRKFLLISGDPGAGKSVLAAWLAGAGSTAGMDEAERDLLAEIRRSWHAAFFCGRRMDCAGADPRVFTQRLLATISRNQPAFARAAAATLPRFQQVHLDAARDLGTAIAVQAQYLWLDDSAVEAGFDRAIRQPLERMSEKDPAARVVLLVDALDEALGVDEPSVVDLILRLSDTPDNLKIMMTSRRDRRVLEQLVPTDRGSDLTRAYEIDLSGPLTRGWNRRDVAAYVDRRLADAASRVPSGESTEVTSEVIRAADGNFQYARHLLDGLARGDLLAGDIGELPHCLHGLYQSYLNRLLPWSARYGAGDAWAHHYQPFLGLLSVARGPVPVETAALLLGIDVTRVIELAGELAQIVRTTGRAGLAEPPRPAESPGPAAGGGASIQFFHASMSDFLGTQELYGARNCYYTSPRAQHERIVERYRHCHQHVWGGDWTRCDTYGLSHLVDHARARLRASCHTGDWPELFELVTDASFNAAQAARLGGEAPVARGYEVAVEFAITFRDWTRFVSLLGRLVHADGAMLNSLASDALARAYRRDPGFAERLLADLACSDLQAERLAAVNAIRKLGFGAFDLLRGLVTRVAADDFRELLARAVHLEWAYGDRDAAEALLFRVASEIRWWRPIQAKRAMSFIVNASIEIYVNRCHERSVVTFVSGLWRIAIQCLHLNVLDRGVVQYALVQASATPTLASRVAGGLLCADVQSPKVFFRSGAATRALYLHAAELFRPGTDLVGRYGEVRALLHSDIAVLRMEAAMITGANACRSFPAIRDFLAEQYPTFTAPARHWHLFGFCVLIPTAEDWTDFLAEHTRYVLEHDRDYIVSERTEKSCGADAFLLPLGLACGKAGTGLPVVGEYLDEAVRRDPELAAVIVESLGLIGFFYPAQAFSLLRSVAERKSPETDRALINALATVAIVRRDVVDLFLAEVGRLDLRRQVFAKTDIRRAKQCLDRVGLFNNTVNQLVRHPVMREGLAISSVSILASSHSVRGYARRFSGAALNLLREHDYDLGRWAAEETATVGS